ncbi:hypothetical protein THICB2_530006 [Thiomonas sp. CB2]|jgi:hypothetical protein|nr:hypothetical protein THICB2_530006 [Thiomonas sp. CB2]
MVSMGEQGRGADELSTLLQAKKGDRQRRLVSAALNQKNLRRKSANAVGLELGLLTLVRADSVKPGV